MNTTPIIMQLLKDHDHLLDTGRETLIGSLNEPYQHNCFELKLECCMSDYWRFVVQLPHMSKDHQLQWFMYANHSIIIIIT